MRSASSFAFFSASSKSMTSALAPSFLAPSFGPTFFAPRMFAFFGPAAPPVADVLRSAADVVIRLAVGAAVVAGLASSAVSTLDSGDAERAMSFPFEPAARNGDGVRPTTGGVAVRDTGGVGFLIAGLSHDEKKSSSGSPAGVELPSALVSPVSVMTTSFGYSSASRAARRLSSSLYLVAALDVYFVLGSLLLRAADPPFARKNLVADSLPPTFINRSWSHCHSVRLLLACALIYESPRWGAYDRDLSI